MRAHYLQHATFEGLGIIGPWLDNAGFRVTATLFQDNPALPAVADIDMLVIMGGPMSANDTVLYPWLQTEKAFIRAFIATGKPVLGVCLGAQLIASTLGAQVYRNPQREIGWFPVEKVPGAKDSPFVFPDRVEAYHWHGDTFDLPEGAVLLASSAACPRQAFSIGTQVLALQCHLESTPETVAGLIEHGRDSLLLPGPYVQTAGEMQDVPLERYQAMNAVLIGMLDTLLSASRSPAPRGNAR